LHAIGPERNLPRFERRPCARGKSTMIFTSAGAPGTRSEAITSSE
jgi:hypothetical protein